MESVAKEVRSLTRAGNIIKKVLLVSNVLVMLFGLLLIGVGGAAVGKQFNALTSTTLASGIIVIGVLLLIIAFVGCWGALKENRILLIIYFSLILFFTLVEFSVGIAAYVHKDDLPHYASESWSFFYNTDRNVLNDLEEQFDCCGFSEPSDRAVPPFGNEPTCATSVYPNSGACSVMIPNYVNDHFGYNETMAYEEASKIQEREKCCGWSSTAEIGNGTAWGVASADDTATPCIVAFPDRNVPCFDAIKANWTAHYNLRNNTGENYILDWENEYRCCGYMTMTSQQIPPYFNNTCEATKGFHQPCEPVMTDSIMQALGAVGGVCIALAILQLATLAVTFYLIRQVPKGGRRNDDDMPEPQEMVDEE